MTATIRITIARQVHTARFKLVNRSPGYAVARLCCIAVTGASCAQAALRPATAAEAQAIKESVSLWLDSEIQSSFLCGHL